MKKSSEQTDEKRDHDRVEVDLPVHLMMNGKQMKATASNLSCGGMFLPVRNHVLKKNEGVEIYLHLANDEPVKIVGNVARIQGSSWFGKKQEGVGIRFDENPGEQIELVQRFVKTRLN